MFSNFHIENPSVLVPCKAGVSADAGSENSSVRQDAGHGGSARERRLLSGQPSQQPPAHRGLRLQLLLPVRHCACASTRACLSPPTPTCLLHCTACLVPSSLVHLLIRSWWGSCGVSGGPAQCLPSGTCPGLQHAENEAVQCGAHSVFRLVHARSRTGTCSRAGTRQRWRTRLRARSRARPSMCRTTRARTTLTSCASW